MSEVDKTIEVDVPVSTAYNQWTQFETFPEFMEGIKEVKQLDATKLQWTAEIAGKTKQWDATITNQEPDQRVAWRNIDGADNAGDVQFEAIGDSKTRIKLHMVYDPEGVVENVGDALGVVSRRVEGDLERFKKFIESRGAETGAFRGEIRQPAPQAASNPQK
ncbi:MAG TPA: SRPBCC family protein [Candidatus Dormibacteraeota bacterium]|nr:SRPBCC family protein [Candidatus Dormibacteraeota bacterium]